MGLEPGICQVDPDREEKTADANAVAPARMTIGDLAPMPKHVSVRGGWAEIVMQGTAGWLLFGPVPGCPGCLRFWVIAEHRAELRNIWWSKTKRSYRLLRNIVQNCACDQSGVRGVDHRGMPCQDDPAFQVTLFAGGALARSDDYC